MRSHIGVSTTAAAIALATGVVITTITGMGNPQPPHTIAAVRVPTRSALAAANRDETRWPLVIPTTTPPAPRPTVTVTHTPRHIPRPVRKMVVTAKPAPRHIAHHKKIRYTVTVSHARATTSPQAYALSLVGRAQFACLKPLWLRESGWNPYAVNPSSGAYGIPQALGHGHPYALGDYVAQINWGLHYIHSRYGSSCSAWAHSQRTGWY